MAKSILYNGTTYPLQFNFLVFKEWENQTGKKISELGLLANGQGAVEAVDALTLLFFAIQDACEEQSIEFKFTLKQFIRGLKFEDMETLISKIDLETENKRQPVAKKKAA